MSTKGYPPPDGPPCTLNIYELSDTDANSLKFGQNVPSSLLQSCIHMRPSSGSLSARFEVRVGQCGLSSSGNIENNGQPNPAGSYLENTIIVQYDPQVQEVWDQGGRRSMLQFIKN